MSEFQLVQQIMKDEISRDRWLAVQAAERLGAGECIDTIETELLSALCEWLHAELQDRDRQGEHYTDDVAF